MKQPILAASLCAALLGLAYADETDKSGAGALKYLDNLKMCAPFTYSYPHPFVKGFRGQNIIKGKIGGNCLVSFVMPGDKRLECQFSPETVALLTNEAAYEQARQQKFTGSTSDPANTRMQQECKF